MPQIAMTDCGVVMSTTKNPLLKASTVKHEFMVNDLQEVRVALDKSEGVVKGGWPRSAI